MAAVVLELKAFAIGQLAALAAQLAAQPAVPDPAAGPLAGSLAASLGAQATAVAATRVALQRAWAGAAAVGEGAVVPVLRSAEARLRGSQAVPWPARPAPPQPTPQRDPGGLPAGGGAVPACRADDPHDATPANARPTRRYRSTPERSARAPRKRYACSRYTPARSPLPPWKRSPDPGIHRGPRKRSAAGTPE